MTDEWWEDKPICRMCPHVLNCDGTLQKCHELHWPESETEKEEVSK